jgi:hypothetical protein
MLLNDFKKCLEEVNKQCSLYYEKYNISDLLTVLDKEPTDRIRPYKIDTLEEKFNQILDKHGTKAFNEVRKVVLLASVIKYWEDIHSDQYPQSIKEQYERNLKRFLDTCHREMGWADYDEDVYWKDLSMARQQIFPAGAQIVEAFSGIGWRQGLSINLLQSLKYVSLILSLGGRIGYYQIHTHIPELSEFNEKGWNNCYGRIAEMLERNEEIKGMCGGSWFYDPQLEFISPRLMYLQRIPLNNGASLFHVGEDKTGNAIAKSKTRLNLYNKGKYKPQSYLLIWPRRELIEWANNYKLRNCKYKNVAI